MSAYSNGCSEPEKEIERSGAVVDSCVALDNFGLRTRWHAGHGHDRQMVAASNRTEYNGPRSHSACDICLDPIEILLIVVKGVHKSCSLSLFLSFSFVSFYPFFFRFLSGKLKNQESGVHGGCSSIGGSECKIRLLEFLLNLEQLTAANKQQLAAISFAPIFNDPLLRIFLYLNGLWLTGWNGDDEVRLSTVVHVHVLINLPHKQVYTGLFWSCNLNNSCIVEISKRRHWHPMIQPKRWECQP